MLHGRRRWHCEAIHVSHGIHGDDVVVLAPLSTHGTRSAVVGSSNGPSCMSRTQEDRSSSPARDRVD